MKVRAFAINKGTASQVYKLVSEDGDVLHNQPGWKTEKGAKNWAQKHGLEYMDEKEEKTMAKKAEIVKAELVVRNGEPMIAVTYSTGTVRYYVEHIPPESVKEFLGGRGEWVNRLERMRKSGRPVEIEADQKTDEKASAKKIVNAYTLEETRTCYVTYESGAERMYPANKIPKTVQAWMEANAPEEAAEPEPVKVQEPEQKPELEEYDVYFRITVGTVAEKQASHKITVTAASKEEAAKIAEETADRIGYAQEVVKHGELTQAGKEFLELTGIDVRKPIKKEPEALPAVSEKANLEPDNSPYASEAVAFGMCLAFAVAFWGIVGTIQILAAGIEVLASWLWSHRDAVIDPTIRAGRWVVAKSIDLASSLPQITTKRGLVVAIRVLPILIGMIALA